MAQHAIQAAWGFNLLAAAAEVELTLPEAHWREYLIQAAYLTASVFFILGLKGLTAPDKARRGMQLAAIGMLIAVVGTLFHHDIVSPIWILIGLVVGSAVGAAISIWMPMTAIPQRTAISHAFGALAATLVGIAHYHFMTRVAPWNCSPAASPNRSVGSKWRPWVSR